MQATKSRSLKSETEAGIAKKALELVRTTTATFERWHSKDIARLVDYVKVLKYSKYDTVIVEVSRSPKKARN